MRIMGKWAGRTITWKLGRRRDSAGKRRPFIIKQLLQYSRINIFTVYKINQSNSIHAIQIITVRPEAITLHAAAKAGTNLKITSCEILQLSIQRVAFTEQSFMLFTPYDQPALNDKVNRRAN
jgi:hypothetical protein